MQSNRIKGFEWLWDEKRIPLYAQVALTQANVAEVQGEGNNPAIINYAKKIGGWISRFYTKDSIPWCGLFAGYCLQEGGIPVNQKILAAKEFLNFGEPRNKAQLWDLLIFQRPGGGHVGFYVGEDETRYFVYGGNQKDKVGVIPVDKNRCIGVRRLQDFKGSRKIIISSSQKSSKNEA